MELEEQRRMSQWCNISKVNEDIDIYQVYKVHSY